MTDGSRYGLDDLLQLMRRLRDPDDGCPWDLKQDFKSIARHTLEEAYELIDALEREDHAGLEGELGDLLFQVVFYCRLSEERQGFGMAEVIDTLVCKLVARHPHVFPDGTLDGRRTRQAPDESVIKGNWERGKTEERRQRGQHSLLDDVPLALPALTRAQKLQKRASLSGLDWDSAAAVREALSGELAELDGALAGGDADAVRDELGDVLFTVVNLCRHLDVDAESALRQASGKFDRRFRHVEKKLSDSGAGTAAPEVLQTYWDAAKQRHP